MTALESLIGFHAHLQLEVALRIVVALTLIAGTALLLRRVAAGRDPVTAHSVLTFALTASLAMPVIAVVVPVLPLPYDLPSSLVHLDNTPHMGPFRMALADFLGIRGAATSSGAAFRGPGPLAWLSAAWLVVAAGLAARQLVGLVRVRRRIREAERKVPAWMRVVADRHSREAGIGRPIDLALSDTYDVPVTFGLRRPVILLPADAVTWRKETAAAALQHEIAHVARSDWVWQMLGSVACVAFWFHPLVWHAAQIQRQTAELSADGHVLESGRKASSYARSLVEVATRRPLGSWPRSTVALAPASALESRLAALGDFHAPRKRRAMVPLLVIAAVVLTTGVAAPVLVGGCHAAVLAAAATLT